MNVRKKLKPSPQRVRNDLTPTRLPSYLPFGQSEDEEPPAKMTKLAIVEEREEDKYDHVTNIKCWTSDPESGIIVPDSPNICYLL